MFSICKAHERLSPKYYCLVGDAERDPNATLSLPTTYHYLSG